MERLTMPQGVCQMASTEYCLDKRDCYECGHGRKVFKSLAAYEDTGREPYEIAALDHDVAMLKQSARLANELAKETTVLRARLAEVEGERDAAVEWIQAFTESVDQSCIACEHYTGSAVCKPICSDCGRMGASSCKWKFKTSRKRGKEPDNVE